jgi:hypothetical protein
MTKHHHQLGNQTFSITKMAQFVGCWKSDSSKHQNFDTFAKASGN